MQQMDPPSNGGVVIMDSPSSAANATNVERAAADSSEEMVRDYQVDGVLDLSEFLWELTKRKITPENQQQLIKQLDPDSDGNLTSSECIRFLDRTRFRSLTSPTCGFKIEDTALRAIEVAQLERLYQYVEDELEGDKTWEVTRFVDGDKKVTETLDDPKQVNLYHLCGESKRPVNHIFKNVVNDKHVVNGADHALHCRSSDPTSYILWTLR